MAANSKTTAYSDLVLGLLRGTGITAPASVDIALHKATTLGSTVTAGATSVSLANAPAVGSTIVLDPDNAASESRVVSAVSGAGPYTVTVPALTNGHTSGAYVQIDPGEALGNLIEVSGGSYARQNIVCNTTNFTAQANGSAGRQTTNNSAINYPQATADWGCLTHFVVYNSTTGWYYGALSAVKVVKTNDTFSIPAGGLVIQED